MEGVCLEDDDVVQLVYIGLIDAPNLGLQSLLDSATITQKSRYHIPKLPKF